MDVLGVGEGGWDIRGWSSNGCYGTEGIERNSIYV